jgi:ABC-2 type transport system permease protein
MPQWLKVIAHVNPLTYEVDALRALMLSGGTSTYGFAFDLIVLIIITGVLVLLGAKVYPSVAT